MQTIHQTKRLSYPIVTFCKKSFTLLGDVYPSFANVTLDDDLPNYKKQIRI